MVSSNAVHPLNCNAKRWTLFFFCSFFLLLLFLPSMMVNRCYILKAYRYSVLCYTTRIPFQNNSIKMKSRWINGYIYFAWAACCSTAKRGVRFFSLFKLSIFRNILFVFFSFCFPCFALILITTVCNCIIGQYLYHFCDDLWLCDTFSCCWRTLNIVIDFFKR